MNYHGLVKYVIDWQLVSALGQLAVGLVLAIITGIYVSLTHRIMKASLVQAGAAEALAKLTLETHRDDKRRNAEKVLSTFSLIDMQVAWLLMEIDPKDGRPRRFAAKHAERMFEPLSMSRKMLRELDELPMQAEVRAQLRDTNGALLVLIDSIPRPLGFVPGYEISDVEAEMSLNRVTALANDILANAKVAMGILKDELRTLADEKAITPLDSL